MINALFVVWRECFEAVLIVGILSAYLMRQQNVIQAKRFMWAGVAAGATLSALLALGFQKAQTELQGVALEIFEASMLLIAATLMTQMCLWMKQHARSIRSELEHDLRGALSRKRLIGVAVVAALAIAREGFELVMFFYGMGLEASASGQVGSLAAWGAAGVGLTAVSAWAYYKGLRFFKPRVFFGVTTVFLFVTAGSLLMAALRKFQQMDLIPYTDVVWDTSWLLDERTEFGQFFSTATGYESTPQLLTALVYVAYWVLALGLYSGLPTRRPRLSGTHSRENESASATTAELPEPNAP